MSKIKFNKEWYNDNRVAVNCKTKEEAKIFIIELAKTIGIAHWFDKDTYYCSHEHGEETCYSCCSDKIVSDTKSVYIKNGFLVIKFSDLEFERDIECLFPFGWDIYLNTMTDSKIEHYKALTNSCTVEKPEPIEVDPPIKRTILRGDVKLSTGDIISINNNKTGIVIGDCVSWNDGNWQHISDKLYDSLVWIIPSESLKTDKGYEVSKLLFENELVCSLKDLIIHVEDTPKEIETIIILEVKFSSVSGMSYTYISDNDYVSIDDIVSPISGHHSNMYGTVVSAKCKDLTQEQIDTYDKVIKIK
jgi:hypothetical protein